MIKYTEVQGMRKQAFGGLVGSAAQGTMDLFTSLGVMGSVYLIATSMLGGTALGWTAAKLSAPSKQDKDTIRKAYDNERLSADLSHVKERLRDEYNMANKAMAPVKPIRVF